MEQSLDIIMTLLRTETPVTFKNHRWDLREARLHLRPYSQPLFDVLPAAFTASSRVVASSAGWTAEPKCPRRARRPSWSILPTEEFRR
jgi:limonene 1,2-monooxygenase